MTANSPICLIRNPGDRKTLCGRNKLTTPYGVAHFLPQWREGHARSGRPLIVCPECLAIEEGRPSPSATREVIMPRGKPELPPPDPNAIEWREPPARSRGRPGIWFGVLQPLTERVGEWAMIRNAGTVERAQGIASNLRSNKMVKPAGKWEIVARDEEVFARYIGPD